MPSTHPQVLQLYWCSYKGKHFGVCPCDSPSARPGSAQPVPSTLTEEPCMQVMAPWISKHPETARVGPCSPLHPAELLPPPRVSYRSPGPKRHHWGQPPCCARHLATSCPAACLFNPPHRDPDTPGCPISHGKVPSQSHVSPARDALPAPQCPAGVTTTQGSSFSVHLWPPGASTHCHVHMEQCRNAVQENSAVTWPCPSSRWIYGDGY